MSARLRAPRSAYDGQNRGGLLNIRYSQFRPDVVRIVMELESLRDYQLEYADEAIRVTFGSDRSFEAWSSTTMSNWAVADDPPPPPPPSSATTTFKPLSAVPLQRSQQPPVTVTYDSAHIRDVANAFAEYSGKSIIMGLEILEVAMRMPGLAFRR